MDSELEPETPSWRTLVKNTVKCSDFKEYNDYCSAKAKQKVQCPYCNGEYSYSSMDYHVGLKHATKEVVESVKTIVREKNKLYYEKNADKKIECSRKYYEEHKEELTMKQKEKVICECGALIAWGGRSKHIQTNRHEEALLIKNNGKILL